MKNRFLITLGVALTVVLLTAASAEAKNFKHFRKQQWKGGPGNGWIGGPGNGNRVAFTGHPVFGYNHPAHGAFHPAFGVTGKKSVLGNVFRAIRW